MAGRFTFVNADYIDQRIKDRIPVNTRRNNIWSVNTWNLWISERNNARLLGQPKFPTAAQLQFITPLELNEYLCYFVLEVRTKHGRLYPKDTLHNLVCGLARYLKDELLRPDLNFMNTNNMYFNRFRQTLDSQMKLATEEGIGTVKKRAQPITPDQENVLWEKEILNLNTALGLFRAVYFYNCKVFGLRSRDEHRSLQLEQYSFDSDDSGNFLKFNRGNSKNVTGGLAQRRVQLKEVRQYDTEQKVSVYKIFKTYIECVGDKGNFYRKPLPPRYHGDLKFGTQPIALNILGSDIKNMMREAGFTGHYTSRSGKVTLATALFYQGVDEQFIKERTGHRSEAIGHYKEASSAQQKVMSQMVDIPNGNKTEKKRKQQIPEQESSLPPRKRKALREFASVELPDEEDKALVPDVEDKTLVPDVEDKVLIPDEEDKAFVPDAEEKALVPDVEDKALVPDVGVKALDKALAPDVEDKPLVLDVDDKALVPDADVKALDKALAPAVEDKALVPDVYDKALVTDVEHKSLVPVMEDKTLVQHVEDKALVKDVEDKALVTDVEDKALVPDVEDKTLVLHVEDKTLVSHVEDKALVHSLNGTERA